MQTIQFIPGTTNTLDISGFPAGTYYIRFTGQNFDKMRWISFVMFFSLMVFYSCKSPKNEDVIGTWQSNDSTRFQFCNDGTFNVKKMPKSILFGNYKDENLFSGTGVWNIQYLENTWKIELIFPKSDALPGGLACYLNIEKKITLDNSSWNLFFYGEDFENKYIFIRTKK